MAVKDKAVTFKIGNGQRGDIIAKDAKDMPGPGNYAGQHENTFGKNSQSYSFKQKFNDKVTDLPGPGQYETKQYDILRAKSSSMKFSSSLR